MLKLNKRNLMLVILIGLSLLTMTPFINGLGCNASFFAVNARLGTLYGKCEYGRITLSVKHVLTNETYNAKGLIGYLGGKYFVLITNREVLTDNTGYSDIHLRPFYYRGFYSGDIIGEEKKYLIYSSPEPTITQIYLNGKLGVID